VKTRCAECPTEFQPATSLQIRCPPCQKEHRRLRQYGNRVPCPRCPGLMWPGSAKCRQCDCIERWRNNPQSACDPVKEPGPIEIAWVAGFYEGEGSCAFAPTGSLRASFPQKNLEPLLLIRDYFGGGITGPNARGVHVLQLYGRRAADLLRVIYPYLSSRRKDQVIKAVSRVAALREEVVGGDSFSDQRLAG
jgi:hypothetical protein